MEQQSHHTIIKNATALTLRMVFTTLIGVYTFRIVLDALGIDNYGIYTLVFGIIGTVTFLNTSMAGATSRFLSYALGQDNGQKTGKIFSAALICHTCIASIVFIISETVGLWFLNSKLNIPDESMAAANVVYQLSVVSMVVGFTQVPYTAVILSYEKMTIYAYIEILNALLKLFIAFFILTLSAERLVIYASLLTGTSVIVMFIYRLYCVRQFVTARFHRPVDLKICKKMLSYSAFDLYGNMCESARTQTIPLILNLFFGVIANAAAGIASTVSNIFSGFSFAIIQAFRPQIIKQYASKNFTSVEKLMRTSALFATFVYCLIAIPFYVCTEDILYIWLGEIPPYSMEFIRLMLIALVFSLGIIVTNIGIQATGDLRRISAICGSVYLFIPIVSYAFLKLQIMDIYGVYVLNILALVASYLTGLWILKKQMPQVSLTRYITPTVKCLLVSSIIAILFLHKKTVLAPLTGQNTIFQVVIVSFVSTIALSIVSYLFIFDKAERIFILENFGLRRIA